ncbi:threonine dehydrogenase-like Zn-dependent dehydrogenase [Streptosporangium album]|uniref:Threonine dehydrogenase-like Zn-dependent dehydrogenase n=1 Tax=Streptosporangium album TaxID=47479 RepID=A0A7W7S3D5_9ACTN|nr:alcohol dehydrogenase catalytic domain-containing protein [Streptosporangium album]MBB4943180.1 threonine dehydrogenase-like Zn-dependent dehydrogenase [Streptosporangium album]
MKAVVFAGTRSVAVEMVKPGDRVVIPTHVYCGVCVNCARGLSAACLRVRPGGFGAAYGYAGMGPYRGAQAELLRVPFADANCIPVPGEPGDDREDDLVLLADAFVTGWHATELAQVTAGATVAVFGGLVAWRPAGQPDRASGHHRACRGLPVSGCRKAD